MNHKLKLAIIGGTGKSGKYVVKQLLAAGYRLKLLMRSPAVTTSDNPNIEIVKGDARSFESIRELIRGCDAVISTLGQPKGEPTIFSQATANVIRAMTESSITRYIVTTGLNVDTPFDRKGEKTKMATEWMKANYLQTTNDKQIEYDLLTKSNLKWTLVRLPLIKLTDEKRNVVVNLEDCLGDEISATDLAIFLVDQLKSIKYVKQAPFIANSLV